MVRLLENAIVSQKINLHARPQAKLSLRFLSSSFPYPGKRKLLIPPQAVFSKIYPLVGNGRRKLSLHNNSNWGCLLYGHIWHKIY